MADELTSIAAGTGMGTNTVETILDLVFNQEFRENAQYANGPFIYNAPKRGNLNSGDTVRLFKDQWDSDAVIDATLTPLDEEEDVDSVRAPEETYTEVTVAEYGHAKSYTKLLELLSFAPIGAKIAKVNADTLVQNLDRQVQNTMDTASVSLRSGAAANDAAITSSGTHKLTTGDLAKAYAKLRASSVPTFGGGLYWCGLHPDVAYDLRQATGEGSWRYPQEVGGQENGGRLGTNYLGVLQGFRFYENTWTKHTFTGSGSAPVYRTFCMGPEAIAQVWAMRPEFVVGPEVDKLRRKRDLGWKYVAGWGVYRPESIYKIHSGSSNPNVSA